MKTFPVLRVSKKRAFQFFKAAKDTLSWVKFFDFLAKLPDNVRQSETLMMVFFALSTQSGWLILGWILAASFAIQRFQGKTQAKAPRRRRAAGENVSRSRKPPRPNERAARDAGRSKRKKKK